ncbi:MAG: hypothetical protein JWL70_282 [Acidimicrobiia bacterium]|nr:hypothetical protein [Acidimicrobiia bacterium]
MGQWFWEMRLIDGPIPRVATVLAPAALAWLVWLFRARWRMLAVTAAISIGAVAVSKLFLAHGVIGMRYPFSFNVWVGFACFSIITAGAVWTHRSWGERFGAALAASVAVLFTATTINAHYAYYPSVGDLAGRPLPHETRLDRVVEATLAAGPTSDAEASAVTTGQGSRRLHRNSRGEGEVVRLSFPAVASGFRHRAEYVYLPAAWHETPRPVLPVVMMLAGTPGAPDNWLRAGNAAAVADGFARVHHDRAPILVFPDHNGGFGADTECVDGPRGRAATYLTVDVRDFVVSAFGARSDAAGWAVAGLSEGGTCAVDLVVSHPDLFGHFVDLSGDLRPTVGDQRATVANLYGGDREAWDRHDLPAVLARGGDRPITGWFGAGRSDSGPLAAARTLHGAAERSGIRTVLSVGPGGHSFVYWRTEWVKAFDWLTQELGMT